MSDLWLFKDKKKMEEAFYALFLDFKNAHMVLENRSLPVEYQRFF